MARPLRALRYASDATLGHGFKVFGPLGKRTTRRRAGASAAILVGLHDRATNDARNTNTVQEYGATALMVLVCVLLCRLLFALVSARRAATHAAPPCHVRCTGSRPG